MRFAFGKNWKDFLKNLNDESINEAKIALSKGLALTNLTGKKFIDIGCGSGLMSLVANGMGATVLSFDYDIHSVEATKAVKDKYGNNNSNWSIQQGSILDRDYLNNLGKFDIIYSWGVLHHTGNMWKAIDNLFLLANESSIIFIALYNDQGLKSKIWKKIKYLYNTNIIGKFLISAIFIPTLYIYPLIKGKNPISIVKNYKKTRGMNRYNDLIDWIGGYPFEVEKPDVIIKYFKERGYTLIHLKTTKSLGCNEFVFQQI